MIVLISPAKQLRRGTVPTLDMTQPAFCQEAHILAQLLAQYAPFQLESLLHVNPQLAMDAFAAYQGFSQASPLYALTSFWGLQFQHLNSQDFSREDFLFAQEHLRILSAFYGVLRPLDAIRPHRLEFACSFFPQGKTLYQFWDSRPAQFLKGEDTLFVSLASQEYAREVLPHLQRMGGCRVIACRFLQTKRGKLRTLATHAKMARGEMARWIIKNRLTAPEQLLDFSWDGYQFAPLLSSDDILTFLQPGHD